ncbi:MAG: hypothetical protein AAF039_13470 [Bacteroidota bacterium]
MKKLNFKYGLLWVGMVGMLFTACEEAEQEFDLIQDIVGRGAVLRTVNVISNEIPIGQGDAEFAVELEVQDRENGNLTQSVEVWVRFNDTTVEEGGTDFTTEEVLAETLDPSNFTVGEFGLPRFSYSISQSELLAVLPISDDTVDGSDEFYIRFELVLADGRRFSVADNTGNITGTFFSSPFQYSATVICPPKPPSEGVWTVEMQDSFGDGWQPTTGSGGGPGLVITLTNGTVFEIGLCTTLEDPGYDCTDGVSEGTASFEVPAGLEGAADFEFRGDFFGEISFQIITPNGNVVADIATGQAAGNIPIDFCKD